MLQSRPLRAENSIDCFWCTLNPVVDPALRHKHHYLPSQICLSCGLFVAAERVRSRVTYDSGKVAHGSENAYAQMLDMISRIVAYTRLYHGLLENCSWHSYALGTTNQNSTYEGGHPRTTIHDANHNIYNVVTIDYYILVILTIIENGLQ